MHTSATNASLPPLWGGVVSSTVWEALEVATTSLVKSLASSEPLRGGWSETAWNTTYEWAVTTTSGVVAGNQSERTTGAHDGGSSLLTQPGSNTSTWSPVTANHSAAATYHSAGAAETGASEYYNYTTTTRSGTNATDDGVTSGFTSRWTGNTTASIRDGINSTPNTTFPVTTYDRRSTEYSVTTGNTFNLTGNISDPGGLLSLHFSTTASYTTMDTNSITCKGPLCIGLTPPSLNTTLSNGSLSTDFSLSGPPENQKNWEVLLLLFFMVAGILGNLLVCIAVSMEKKLQNVTNYFLMSLAIADLLVSVIVMPCSIVNEFLGYWPFDLIICDLWQVSDVMMCTSSIMHMCTISLDRYISIRNPLRIRNKSRTVVGIKMAVVWLLSLMIASPIILLSVLNPQNVLSNYQCAIFNQYFLIYGSLAAYFVPLTIMFIAYTLTIHLLNKQAKLCSKNCKKAGVPMMRRSTSVRRKRHHISRPRNIPEMPATNGLNLARKLQTHIDRNRAHPSEREPLHDDEQEADSETQSPVVSRWRRMGAQNGNQQHGNGSEEPAPGSNDAEADERSLKLHSLVKKHSAAIKVAGILLQKRNENQQKKEQMNTVKTERKAVKVLGTMFGIFFVCWAPFFSLNFAIGVCESCNIQPSLFKVFLWLGYVSSTLNPIIYTIFNKTFKRTFIAILTCKIFTEQTSQKSVTFTTTNGTSIKVKYDSTTHQNAPIPPSAESMV